MRLIDADELLKEVTGIHDGWLQPPKEWRSVEDSIRNAPTINPKELLEEKYKRLLQLKKEIYKPTEQDSDWWYNRKTGIIDGLQIAFETFTNMRS